MEHIKFQVSRQFNGSTGHGDIITGEYSSEFYAKRMANELLAKQDTVSVQIQSVVTDIKTKQNVYAVIAEKTREQYLHGKH